MTSSTDPSFSAAVDEFWGVVGDMPVERAQDLRMLGQRLVAIGKTIEEWGQPTGSLAPRSSRPTLQDVEALFYALHDRALEFLAVGEAADGYPLRVGRLIDHYSMFALEIDHAIFDLRAVVTEHEERPGPAWNDRSLDAERIRSVTDAVRQRRDRVNSRDSRLLSR
jgi:hypothetical protein